MKQMEEIIKQAAMAAMVTNMVTDLRGIPGSHKNQVAKIMATVVGEGAPFIAPPHTLKVASVYATLEAAEGGILFLDSITEFDDSVIEAIGDSLSHRNIKLVVGSQEYTDEEDHGVHRDKVHNIIGTLLGSRKEIVGINTDPVAGRADFLEGKVDKILDLVTRKGHEDEPLDGLCCSTGAAEISWKIYDAVGAASDGDHMVAYRLINQAFGAFMALFQPDHQCDAKERIARIARWAIVQLSMTMEQMLHGAQLDQALLQSLANCASSCLAEL